MANPLQGRVEGLLARAGKVFGEGELRGKLTRVVGFEGPANAPTGERTDSYEFIGIWSEFDIEERAAGLVEDGDHKLLIGTASPRWESGSNRSTEPRVGDRVAIGGVSYTVKKIGTVKPGGTALLYPVTVRQ